MNWLRRIFSSEAKLPPADLSILECDLHSHLIPGIDDGSKSMEESLAMIRRFSELGYQRLITTPHVMSDFYKNSPETILTGASEVKKELESMHLQTGFKAAAEYYLDEFFIEKVKEKSVLTLGNQFVLFELPFLSEPPNLSEAIFEMQTNGYKPILAHPERYGYWYDTFDKYRELKDRGVYLQLNMLSLIGHYSPQTQKIAERMIDEGLVDFLASDCHHMAHLDLIEIVRTKKYLHQLLESGKLLNASLK